MADKKILLRGISRIPSNRATSDGGCSESLNVQLEQGELQPILPPEDITSAAGLPDNFTGDILYLHKAGSVNHYVCLYGGSIGFFESNYLSSFNTLFALEEGEEIKDITSVGNTLIIATNKNVHYSLYKAGVYKYLGTQIPMPAMVFTNKDFSISDTATPNTGAIHVNNADDGGYISENKPYYHKSEWNLFNQDRESSFELARLINEQIISKSNELYATTASSAQPYFWAPMYACVAIELYDGSQISSLPILVGAGNLNMLTVKMVNYVEQRFIKGSPDTPLGTSKETDLEIYPSLYYKLWAKLENFSSYESWSDIISYIDIYLSPAIDYRLANGFNRSEMVAEPEVVHIDERQEVEDGDPYIISDTATSYLNFTGKEESPDFEKALLSQSNFYRVARYVIGSPEDKTRVLIINEDDGVYDFAKYFDALSAGELIPMPTLCSNEATPQDLLVTQPRLDNYVYYTDGFSADNVNKYNNSIIYGAITKRAFSKPYYPSENYSINANIARRFPVIAPSISNAKYEMIFYIRSDYNPGGVTTYSRTFDGNTLFDEKISRPLDMYSTYQYYFGWLMFPDTRCFKVVINARAVVAGATVTKTGEFNMYEHPLLNCSYCYIDPTTCIFDLLTAGAWVEPDENAWEYMPNKLYITPIDNPFIVQPSGKFTLSATIIGTAISARALSTGQFGQFPIMIFTEEGIWALELTSTGSYSNLIPVAREVCVSKDSISGLDYGILFTTDKNVGILNGSDVKNISLSMNGKHYILEQDARQLLSGTPWGKLVDITSDGTAFMLFAKSAKPVYDYAGDRIIFFKRDESYAYVYMLQNDTWHKLSLPEKCEFDKALNSYPSAYISMKVAEQTGTKDGYEITGYSGSYNLQDDVQVRYVCQNLFNDSYYETLTDPVGYFDENTLIRFIRQQEAITIPDNWGEQEREDFVSVFSENQFTMIEKMVPQYTKYTRLYDYSTFLDVNRDASVDKVKGIVITRPFDCDATDIYKSIENIILRGDYAKGNVKYILLASNDGMTFHRITSLRGPSWKFFRLVILTDMTPVERLAYFEVVWNNRFLNKAR